MSVVMVLTAFPIPEHGVEVIAAVEAAITRVHSNQALSSTRCTRGATGWS
jgi:hypothetical protein